MFDDWNNIEQILCSNKGFNLYKQTNNHNPIVHKQNFERQISFAKDIGSCHPIVEKNWEQLDESMTNQKQRKLNQMNGFLNWRWFNNVRKMRPPSYKTPVNY